MTELSDRVREHEYPHVRSIDTQTLDALLRIEELLEKLIQVAAIVPQITVEETVAERGNYEDRHTPVTSKRKNPRQL